MPRRSFLVAVLFFTLAPVFLAPGGRGDSLAATKSISVTPRIQSKLAEGKRYALIIGLGRYRDGRIPPLRYTVADARAMYDVLTDPRHGRFPKGNVRLLLDERATLVNIRKGLNWLVREAGEDDTVVVYYSGHGAPEGDETFWISYDADIDDIASTAVENRYITGRLERIKAKRLASFLDSCYSAAIVEKRDAPKALFDQDFFTNYQGTGRVTITASDGKQLSLESEELGHGIFTYFLLEALRGKADRNGDGAVEIEEVWAHLRRKVTDEARRRNNTQEPRIIGSFSAGFLLSLNPAALAREKARRDALTRLLRDRRITGVEFEEAVGILDGEIGGKRGALLLPLVRQLADGRLLPGPYRLALAGVTARLAPGRPGPAARPSAPPRPASRRQVQRPPGQGGRPHRPQALDHAEGGERLPAPHGGRRPAAEPPRGHEASGEDRRDVSGLGPGQAEGGRLSPGDGLSGKGPADYARGPGDKGFARSRGEGGAEEA